MGNQSKLGPSQLIVTRLQKKSNLVSVYFMWLVIFSTSSAIFNWPYFLGKSSIIYKDVFIEISSYLHFRVIAYSFCQTMGNTWLVSEWFARILACIFTSN